MSWKPPKSYAGEVKGYMVLFYYSNGKGHHNFTVDADTTAFFVGFSRSNTYCATVLAFNEGGDGPAPKCINITTRDGGRKKN